jgi:glycosyltransferase involved in cell wall biosynthesis
VKRVLIITYYWPPSGGAGVQRWLKFSKYLPEFGWQPVIYTPDNPDFSIKDESLLKDIPKKAEILQTKIWEPYSLYKSFSGKQSENANAGFFAGGKKSWKQRLSIFIRGNFFIPDPRVFWVKPSIKYLENYLKEHPVDAIVSTGPPHSMHLIGLGVKKKFPHVKWIADFRDPWTDIDFYHELNLTSWADKKHKRLEAEVIKNADEVVTVSDNWAKDLEKNHHKNINVITNGFDEEDFINLPSINTSELIITHLGSINKDRNPHVLWRALSELKIENSESINSIKIHFIGQLDESVLQSVKEFDLENYVVHTKYLTHNKAIEEASKSTALLLLVNNTPNLMGIVPGKLFEYLALKRFIINIGPKEGNSSKIIEECEAGTTIEFEDIKAMKVVILSLVDNNKPVENASISKYSRKVLAKSISDLF